MYLVITNHITYVYCCDYLHITFIYTVLARVHNIYYELLVLVACNGLLFDIIFLIVEVKCHNYYKLDQAPITLYFAGMLYSGAIPDAANYPHQRTDCCTVPAQTPYYAKVCT